MFRKIFSFVLLITLSLPVLAFTTKAQNALLMEVATGAVLYEKNAYVKTIPSSMSKLMTLYIAFQRLKDGNMKLNDKFLVSERAWRTQGSRMFLEPNTYVSVENLLRGIIIQSGNDATVALAEGIAGSESDFVELMNYKANDLGLKYSHFANSTGLPDANHYMSTEDIATLSLRLLKDFPDYYHYFSEKEFTFNKIKQPNRNLLLNANIGVDGLKTGHTESGKYGIAVSAVKDGRRIILVVNGLKTEQERATEAAKLLQYGFLNFTNITVANANKPIVEIPVALGKRKTVKLGALQDIIFTVPIAFKGQNDVKLLYPSMLYAPVYKEKKVGEVSIKLYNGSVYTFDLLSLSAVDKSSALRRFFVKAKAFFKTFKGFKKTVETKVQILRL